MKLLPEIIYLEKRLRETNDYIYKNHSNYIEARNIIKNMEDKQKLKDSLNLLLENIRDNCEHKWISNGHDHYDDYYICSLCGRSKVE